MSNLDDDEPGSSGDTRDKAFGAKHGGRLASTSEDKVGYGKPPKAHQFQRGQSGNPKGRRKRAPTVNEQIKTLLHQKVTVTEGGQRKQMTRQEVMVRSIVNNALKGDLKAANFLLGVQNSHRDNSSAAIDPAKLNEDSVALLQEYRRQLQTGEEIVPSADLETILPVDAPVPEPKTLESESHADSEADAESSIAPSTMPTQPIVAPVVALGSTIGPTQLPATATSVQLTMPVANASAPELTVVRATSSGLPRRPPDEPFSARPTPPAPQGTPASTTSAPQPLATAWPEPWKPR